MADPYRWLEDPDSKETLEWVEAQNKITYAFIRTPKWEKIKTRLTKLWNYPKWSLPEKVAGRYFYTKNDGLQNQAVLYVQDRLDSQPKLVLDPNQLSQDGTVALSGHALSEDGKLMAYLLSSKGSDWQEMKIRKIDSGEDFPEVLKWCKFTSIAWKHDGSGFYYNRFPDSSKVKPEDRNAYNRVYFHKLGTDPAEDSLIFENPDDKELSFSPWITEDGKYLVLIVNRGTDPKNQVYYRDVESAGDFVRLLDKADAMYKPVGNAGPVFYFHTDLKGPKGRILAIDTREPAPDKWKEIVAEQKEDVIASAGIVGNRLVITYMQDAHHLLKLFDLQGKFEREIPLPGIGSVWYFSGRQDDNEMFFYFTSFFYPSTIFRYDFTSGQLAVFREPKVDFRPDEFETKQVFYESKDGTRVPMFIAYKKGLELDGQNPTMLYGYGGFNISLTPYFSVYRLVWMESGGVFVQANLRGGNEYGEEWHQGGVLGNKQNVFDDFIAAGEWLIENSYTRPGRLAIMGGSNGGLLTAACMLQRPELFGAVLSLVPVIDMLRYHKFSVGRNWVSDYGNAEKDPEHFKFMYAYSPLHNVKPGIAYPPTLVTTADTDDRVVPLHGKKFAATLQAADVGDNPLLLRVETKAGHGGGKPTSKRIETYADYLGFIFEVFDLSVGEEGN